MRKYGAKKASRPYEQTHRNCSICRGYQEVPDTKSRRGLEKRVAAALIREQISWA